MDKTKDPEEVYLEALKDAFISKTPAEHLADSKYLGLGRGLTERARLELHKKQNPHLVGGNSLVGRYLTVVDLRGESYPRNDAILRLLARMERGKTIQRVVVTQWLKISEVCAGMRLS